MHRETFHCLVAGGGENHLYLLRALKQLGLAVTLVDRNEHAPGRIYADNFINESTADFCMWKQPLEIIHQKLPINAVLTASSGAPVRAVAEAANVLSVESYSRKSAVLATSKAEFRKRFSRGIWYSIASRDSEIPDVNIPVVVKSDYCNFGKNAVRWASDPCCLREAVRFACANSLNGKALLEQLIDGSDYLCLGVVHDGVLLWHYFLKEYNEFLPDGSIRSKGFMGPVKVADDIEELAVGSLRDLIADLDIRRAPVVLSVRRGEKHAIPVEFHLDFGGEMIFDWMLRPVVDGGVEGVLRSLLFGTVPDFREPQRHCHGVLYRHGVAELESYLGSDVETFKVDGHRILISGPAERLARFF